MRTLVVILLAVVGCGQKAPPTNGGGGGSAKAPIAAERNSCAVADDCTLVEACCGCTAAGRRVAIRKDAVAEYDATRPQRCGDSTCAQAISTHSSCHAEAACEAGKCTVMAHSQPED